MRTVANRTESSRARPRRARLGALAALLLAAPACFDGAPPRPDLLLISSSPTGSHGWDHEDLLHCPEASRGASEPDPRFACRLADRGAYYRWAFSAAADPAPSIASLFTSLPAHRHGVTRSPATFARSEAATLAERLAEAGYATGGFTGRARLNRARDLDQGFGLYWVAGPQHDAGDPIRAAAAWIALQQEYDRPWFAWIDLPSPPDPGAAALLTSLAAPESGDPAPAASARSVRSRSPPSASRAASCRSEALRAATASRRSSRWPASACRSCTARRARFRPSRWSSRWRPSISPRRSSARPPSSHPRASKESASRPGCASRRRPRPAVSSSPAVARPGSCWAGATTFASAAGGRAERPAGEPEAGPASHGGAAAAGSHPEARRVGGAARGGRARPARPGRRRRRGDALERRAASPAARVVAETARDSHGRAPRDDRRARPGRGWRGRRPS